MRILVVKLSSLGDLFHALPAAHDLALAAGRRVDWAVSAEYAGLVRRFRDVERVIAFPRRAFFRDFGSFVRELRARRYDWVVDFQGLLKSGLVTCLARGERKIGPSFRREGAGLFYGEIAGRRASDRHAVEQIRDTARYLGVTVGAAEFPVDCPEWTAEGGRPWIAMVPVSRWASKDWPPERFGEVARRLLKATGGRVFVLGGPGDRAVCARVAGMAGEGAENLAGVLGLPELLGALRRMDLLIANDSGPVHMAAAVGTPALVIFGPTAPGRTGPYGAGHRVLWGEAPCRPCYRRRCRHQTVRCMEAVTVEDTAQAALAMYRVPRAPDRFALAGRDDAVPE